MHTYISCITRLTVIQQVTSVCNVGFFFFQILESQRNVAECKIVLVLLCPEKGTCAQYIFFFLLYWAGNSL